MRLKSKRAAAGATVVKEVARFLNDDPAVATRAASSTARGRPLPRRLVIKPVLVELGIKRDIGQPAIQGQVERGAFSTLIGQPVLRLVEKVA